MKFILIPFFLVLVVPAYATQQPIEISEFYPNPPGDDTSQEWIELHNTTEHEQNLDGWTISDVYGTIREFSLLGKTIQSNGYLVILRQESGIALNNDSEQVVLRSPEGQELRSGICPDTSEGKTCAVLSSVWEEATPTQGAENIPPLSSPPPSTSPIPSPTLPSFVFQTPSPQPTALPALIPPQLNEISLCSEKGDWVEIYNPNTIPIKLTGWMVRTHVVQERSLSRIVIQPRGYGVYEWKDRAIDQDGDEVVLMYHDVAREMITIPTCTQQAFWSKDADGAWNIASTPTRGEKNLNIPQLHTPQTASQSAIPNKTQIYTLPQYPLPSFFPRNTESGVDNSQIQEDESSLSNNTPHTEFPELPSLFFLFGGCCCLGPQWNTIRAFCFRCLYVFLLPYADAHDTMNRDDTSA
ncbi:MAG: lamin tail domain-containing protein [Candidatus Pacebacteria bacterium]|nr:lamin tail domain-containing protein [Candidatus Paceibacterota bacterium]